MRHLPQQAALSIIGAFLLLALVILFAPAPRSVVQATPSPAPTTGAPPATATAGATPTVGPTATATAPPTASPAGSSDATAMLRAHNELRSAIGAPLVRSDDRV